MLESAVLAEARVAAVAVALGVPTLTFGGVQLLWDGIPVSAVSAFVLFSTALAAALWGATQRREALFPPALVLAPCAVLAVALYAAGEVARCATRIGIATLLSWSVALHMTAHTLRGGWREPWYRWVALLAACAAATVLEGSLVESQRVSVACALWALVALAAILCEQVLLQNAANALDVAFSAPQLLVGACAIGLPVLGAAAYFERGSRSLFALSLSRVLGLAASTSGFYATIWGAVPLVRIFVPYECTALGVAATPLVLALWSSPWPPSVGSSVSAVAASLSAVTFLGCAPGGALDEARWHVKVIFPRVALGGYIPVLSVDPDSQRSGGVSARKRARLAAAVVAVCGCVAALCLLAVHVPYGYTGPFGSWQTPQHPKNSVRRPISTSIVQPWLPDREYSSERFVTVPLDAALSVWYSLGVCRACSSEFREAAQCAAVATNRLQGLRAAAAMEAGIAPMESFCQARTQGEHALGAFLYRLLCTSPKMIPRCGLVPRGFFAHVQNIAKDTWLRQPEFMAPMRAAFRSSVLSAAAKIGPEVPRGVCAIHLADPQTAPALSPEDFVAALRSWQVRPLRFRLVSMMSGSSSVATRGNITNEGGGKELIRELANDARAGASAGNVDRAGLSCPAPSRGGAAILRLYGQAIARAFPTTPIEIEVTRDEATAWLGLVRAPFYAGGYGVLGFAAAAASHGNVTTPHSLDSASACGKELPTAGLAPGWLLYGRTERPVVPVHNVVDASDVEYGVSLWARRLACGKMRTGACSPDVERSIPTRKWISSSRMIRCSVESATRYRGILREQNTEAMDAVASMAWAADPARWPSVLHAVRAAAALTFGYCVSRAGKTIPTFKNDTCVIAYEPDASLGNGSVTGMTVGRQAAAWIRGRAGHVRRATIISVNATATSGEAGHHLVDAVRSLQRDLESVSVSSVIMPDAEAAFAAMLGARCLFAGPGSLGRVAALLSPGDRAVPCENASIGRTGSALPPCTLGNGLTGYHYERVRTAMVMVLPNAYELAPVREWMVRSALGAAPEWPLVIYHGTEIRDQLRNLASVKENPHRVTLEEIRLDNLNAFPRESVMLSREFWDRLLRWDRVLIVTSGTAVCRRGAVPLEKFLRYDYVGAPWPDIGSGPFAGNGWTSLRSPYLMRQILEKFPPAPGTAFREDYYFAEHVQKAGGFIAPKETAVAFTSGIIEHPESLFASGVGEFKITYGSGMLKACVGVHSLLHRSLPGISKRSGIPRRAPTLDQATAAAKRIRRRTTEPPFDHVVALIAVTGQSPDPVIYTLRNFMTYMDLSKWKFQVLAGPTYFRMLASSPAIAAMVNSTFLEMTQVSTDSGPFPAKYNELLLHKDVWTRILGEKILLIHVDSVICGASPYEIDGFLKFDYAGAYWPGGRGGVPVGNGGTSLRSRSKTLELLNKEDIIGRYGVQNEDILFSQRLPTVGGRVADVQSAGSFACEVHFNSRCLLLHAPLKYNPDMREPLRNYCPEARHLTG